MAIHSFRYSNWDGSQSIPDFTADELLESMADDLLRGGDPERALRSLMRRGFQLPDGRSFQGMQRLIREMREYRQDVFSRYDPNGIVDQVREKLDEILGMERGEIDGRSPHSPAPSPPRGEGEQMPGEQGAGDQSSPTADSPSTPERGQGTASRSPSSPMNGQALGQQPPRRRYRGPV